VLEKMEEKKFLAMVFDFKQKIKGLQAPAVRSLNPEDFEALRLDKELRSKSANYRLLGEDSKADALETKILDIQARVKKIRERLAQTPSKQQEIFDTIAGTPDSELHQEALKIYATGLQEYEKTLKAIEESEEDLKRLHQALAKNAEDRGNLERGKINLYLRLKEVETALPISAHKTVFPAPAPQWDHFVTNELEDAVGKAYGNRPYLSR